MSDSRATTSPFLATVAIGAAYLLGIAAILGVALALRGTEGAGAAGGGSSGVSAPFSLTEYAISGPATILPGKVSFAVTNAGTLEHNLSIEGLDATTPNLGAGGSDTLTVDNLPAGTYELFCSIAGHRESGMSTQLVVSEDAPPVADMAGMDHSGSGGETTQAEWDDYGMKMMANMAAFPMKSEGIGNQVLEPTITPDGAKRFELTAAITKWEVEPGKVVDAWTYNGMVPGPWIKVNVGDRVEVVLQNNLPAMTDIHFHGIHVPNEMDGVAPYTQDAIMPGESFTYSFVADRQALGMYHAHAHGEVAVVNGLFAVFEIGDVPLPTGKTISGIQIPDQINIVREFPMVLNDAGTIGLSLNGKSFPATEPMVVDQNEWFLVNYFNEGFQSHPMHMHGFPQLVVAKDGIALDQPYWADTVNIGAGERYTLLVHATDPGTWVWHCHILNHVEMKDRLFGMATAVVVNKTT